MSRAGSHDFSIEERRAIYRVIHERRDVRSHFLPDPIPDAVLGRVLNAAHRAPSVGFMQPWDFLIVEDQNIRQQVYDNFVQMKELGADLYEGERRALYDSYKLAGILDAPLNIGVTCDRSRSKGHGLGRQSDRMTDIYSTVCAVQNLWLAARAESLGVGWVSIIEIDAVKQILQIPASVDLVAYLCIGYVSEFRSRPELEEKGWETRARAADLIHFNTWTNQDAGRSSAMCATGEDGMFPK